MSSSLVGSNSSGSGGVERGRATNRLQRWQCGGIMHDMPMKLKKGSRCSIFNFTLHSHSSGGLRQALDMDKHC